MNDIIIRPEGPPVAGADRRATIRTAPGGSGANLACWLAAAGVAVTFAGRVGSTEYERHTSLFNQSGVRPALGRDDDLPTGTLATILSPDGERSFFTDRGANDRLGGAELPEELLDGMELLHVSGYALVAPEPRQAVLALVEAAQKRGVPVSVDPGSHSFLREIGPADFLRWTVGASLCFPNAAEAAVLAGTADAREQLDILTRTYPLVAVKRGAAGAVAGRADGSRWSVSAQRVEVLDSSGAGDAFAAAFLVAWLSGGEIPVCLERAVMAGSRAVMKFGGRPGRRDFAGS